MLWPGDHINGYLIDREIGVGGMSHVFLARDSRGRYFAVKRLRDEFTRDPEFVRRFRQEADIMKNLDHPHVAHVYDYIEHDRTCVMVEEHLSGGSLADAISKGPISQTQALIWCRDALLGIDHAHRQGVLHRDLKPGNLMLDAAGDVKVADFGIAKVFGGPKLTQTRSEMGTAAYMSPEQIRTPQKAYHLTDVYSMGVVLFELLTGKVPFERDTDFETKQAIVREPPPELRDFNPDISIELQRIVLQAMEKDQHRRYGGCAEFSKRIDAYLEGEEPRRYPWWIPVLLVILTLFVLLFLASRLGWI